MVLLSEFSEIQLMVFMANIIIISALSRWQISLFNIITGVAIVTLYYQHYYGLTILETTDSSLKFKILYLLLLLSSTLVLFLKPKQEYQELTEAKNQYLSNQIEVKVHAVEEALALKAEFIRNVNHEYNTPITGVMSMAEALRSAYNSLNDEERLQALDVIVESSKRLKEYDENIIILARLNKSSSKLNKEYINFSDLIHERARFCKKLYGKNSDQQECILDVESGIIAYVDKEYISHLLDNLIINAMKYCDKAKISISARKKYDNVEVVIQDEGIGIPTNELIDIFSPFVVSSKTRSRAGGRGVGLAVCKRIAEVHGATIIADSNGIKGAIFKVILPGSTPKQEI